MQSNTLDIQKQRLNQLIELISDQETKLVRLKALCKQAKEQTAVNLDLSNELKSVNNAIKDKDFELRQALNRVDNLNRQLNNYRRTRQNHRTSKSITNRQTTSVTKTQQISNLEHAFKNNSTNGIINANLEDGSNLDVSEDKGASNDNENDNCGKSSIDASAGPNNKFCIERRVSFDPLALLLDAALEGELDLVIQTSKQVPDLNASHDECVTALHNAVVAGHYEVAKYLIEAGCDINVQDSDGWTPLHCAASCNNLPMIKLLVEKGALIYAATTSDNSTPAMECDTKEDGFEECHNYLTFIQNNLGVMNGGVVYALYDYEAQEQDELSFKSGDELIVLRRDDSQEQAWWWAQKRIHNTSDNILDVREGYIPRNLIGLHPRVQVTRHTLEVSSNNSISNNGLVDKSDTTTTNTSVH